MSERAIVSAVAPRDSQRTGAAGEAVVTARLLRLGLDVAKPVPDRGVDLIAFARDMTRTVPIQVKTLTAPSVQFERKWFDETDVVLAIVWPTAVGDDVYVFDGVRDVERFLGASAMKTAWTQGKRRWAISKMASPGQRKRLEPFREAWGVVHSRLGLS